MEELFFATSPIYWLHTRGETLFLVFAILIFCIAIWHGYILSVRWQVKRREKIKQKSLQKKIHALAQESNDWEKQAVHTIKELLQEVYKKRVPLSDTATEIEHYADEKDISNILEKLEKIEYRGEKAREEERKNILEVIQKFFATLFPG